MAMGNTKMNAPEADIDEVSGIPMEWFRQINLACDLFFISRGMDPNPVTFKEAIRQDFELRKQRRKHDNT